MKGAYNRYKDKGLTVIGIGFQDTESNIRAYVKDTSMPWPVAYDADNGVAGLYGVRFGAGTVFIGADGVVKERFLSGFDKERFNEALSRIID